MASVIPSVSPNDPHIRVLRILENRPQISQRELAIELGISLGKVNYLLNALVEKGMVKLESFSRNDGKFKKVAYLITPDGIAARIALTRDYLARKEAEFEQLRHEIEMLRIEQGIDAHTRRVQP